jgi:hypothetical protein
VRFPFAAFWAISLVLLLPQKTNFCFITLRASESRGLGTSVTCFFMGGAGGGERILLP